MRMLWAIVRKDFLQLRRDPAALFFTLGWPLIVAVAFGLVFGGGGASTPPKVAIVDLDRSAASQSFVRSLRATPELATDLQALDAARDAVRRGQRVAAVVLPAGWGASRGLGFSPGAMPAQVWVDPSRKAEQAMLQGLLVKAAMQDLMTGPQDAAARASMLARSKAQLAGADPATRARLEAFYDSLDGMLAASSPAQAHAPADFSPLPIETHSVEARRKGPANAHAVTFPQGMFWAVLGCLMSFATSLATERSEGTWLRLRTAPAAPWRLLAGKGLACGLAMLLALNVLALIAVVAFGIRPHWLLLELAFLCGAFAFTAMMMLFALLARSVRAASGVAWAILMPLAMVGGAMIPLFAMPGWMQAASNASPVKWLLLAIEGAVWRGFSLQEMLMPCAVLVGTGVLLLLVVRLRAPAALA
ncbi:ABC transporter permease [Lysobacter humi (ex Lee et al. 2017)]